MLIITPVSFFNPKVRLGSFYRVLIGVACYSEILMGDNNHTDALYVRGLCRYYQDNQDAAFQHFQKVLRLVPDHSKAKETYKVRLHLSR